MDDSVAQTFERFAAECECQLTHADGTISGKTIDLGRGGLFLDTDVVLEIGTELAIKLRLDEPPGKVLARGEVAWVVKAGPKSRPGLGVRFTAIERGASELEEFLDSDNVTPWPRMAPRGDGD